MALDQTSGGFRRTAACTGPAERELHPEKLVSTKANRWNAEGEPTIYLGADEGVALAEFGRHWKGPDGVTNLWSVELDLSAVLDLTPPDARVGVGMPADISTILDRECCRSTGSRLRAEGRHEALVVPSVAFLDDPERWNVVVFVDRLRRPLDECIRVVGGQYSINPTDGGM